MRYFIFILFVLKILAASADEKFVTCKYSDTYWYEFNNPLILHTCDILIDTIDSPNYKIKFDKFESEKVKGLRFEGNKNVKYLPNNIAEIFPNLEALSASITSLSTLSSDDLKGLSKLKYLSIYNTDLEVIKDFTFKDLSALEVLLLNSNIRLIEENAFHGMTSLQSLELGFNKLNSLKPKTFEPLISLISLSLESNQLEYIDENLFSKNKKLEDIWLNKNKIIGLPFKVFENLPNLYYLPLNGNPCIDALFNLSNFDELKGALANCTAIAPR